MATTVDFMLIPTGVSRLFLQVHVYCWQKKVFLTRSSRESVMVYATGVLGEIKEIAANIEVDEFEMLSDKYRGWKN